MPLAVYISACSNPLLQKMKLGFFTSMHDAYAAGRSDHASDLSEAAQSIQHVQFEAR